MKVRTFIGIMSMLIALVSMTACENEDNPVDNPESKVQTDYYYGHYNSDEKIYLTLNENKVCVNIYKDNKDVSERILANVQALITMEDADDIFDIFVISRPDFEKLASLDFWEEDVRSVILTSGYLTENNEEVYATPYLSVKLKKKEDIDLLTSYTEKYRLRIIGNSSVRPLWYTLTLTPDCEKSPLECANELYESGDFAASAPMLAGGGGPSDQTIVRSITTATPDPSSEIYDLQGRHLSTIPRKGVYILTISSANQTKTEKIIINK